MNSRPVIPTIPRSGRGGISQAGTDEVCCEEFRPWHVSTSLRGPSSFPRFAGSVVGTTNPKENPIVKHLVVSLFVATLATLAAAAPNPTPAMPADPKSLTKTISYADMESLLKSVNRKGIVSVSVEGKTTKGRSIYLVHARAAKPEWTVLFYAQQHGDEISGKDALLYLIRDLAKKPALLPEGVDLWIMPMMNPDGAEAGTRVNGAGVDINRDHITLEQPETRALHRVVQRIRPHIAVDCHEFARETEGYGKRGWTKWPEITMDAINNPLFDKNLMTIANDWVAAAGRAANKEGYSFLRYWVGGVPPDEEQRHSAPDIDSGMNAIGAYGGMSFIMEAAARSGDDAIAKELGDRVGAYLAMIRRVLQGVGSRSEALETISKSRARTLPPFLPTNYFWANPTGAITRFPVIDVATRQTVMVATPNMMTDIVVKKSVATPRGYAIEPRAAAELGALLDRHAVPYEKLAAPRIAEAETCTLVRVEDDFDEVYSRYEGRQIVSRSEAASRELPQGSLWVPLDGEAAARAALLLEPASLYGLFQYPRFRALVGEGGAIPILRVVR